MVVRANSGSAVVAPAGGHGRLVEGVHRGTVLGQDRDMQRLVQSAFAADPEIRLPIGAETCRGIVAVLLLRDFHHEGVVERSQGFQIESLGAFIIRNRKPDVVDHQTLLRFEGWFVSAREVQPRTSSVLLRVLPVST